jgi:hypothetical protein
MISSSMRIQSDTHALTELPKDGSGDRRNVTSRFHALMLQQAFKAMLQTEPAGNGKSTLARDVWRGQLAEHLATAATQGGGLGSADRPAKV